MLIGAWRGLFCRLVESNCRRALELFPILLMGQRRDLFYKELSFFWNGPFNYVPDEREVPHDANRLNEREFRDDQLPESSDVGIISMNQLIGWEDVIPSLPSQALGSVNPLYFDREENNLGFSTQLDQQITLESNHIVSTPGMSIPTNNSDSDCYLTLYEAAAATNQLSYTREANGHFTTYRTESHAATSYGQQLNIVTDEIHVFERNHMGPET